MLAEAIKLDPAYETAWLWFATLAHSDAERRYCYQRALAINPDSPVAADLARMPLGEVTAPPELAELEEPPIPEIYGGARSAGRARSWRNWIYFTAAIMIVALIVGGYYAYETFWLERVRKSPFSVALVADFTGFGEGQAREIEQAVSLYLDFVNDQGGIDGHPVQLVIFDDENDPEIAVARAEAIVEDDRFLAVIGHRTSLAAMAAKPIYEEAGIPVITSTASVDDLTSPGAWHFRTVYPNHHQAELIAVYIRSIWNEDSAYVIAEENPYGESLRRDFVEAMDGNDGDIRAEFSLSSDIAEREAQLVQVIDGLIEDGSDDPIFLATNEAAAYDAIVAIRDAGINNRLIGADSITSDAFLARFGELPAEQEAPGFYTDGIFGAAPVLLDNLTGDGLQALERFEEEYGYTPSWRALTSVDAGVALVNAIERSRLESAEPIERKRALIRDTLASFDSPQSAIPGVVGAIWFDETRSVVHPVALGIANERHFASAPLQLGLYDEHAFNESIDDGQLFDAGDHRYYLKRVARAGIDVSLIRDLNTQERTFFADFYVWIKYPGDDDATDIVFTNWTDIEQFLVDEIRATTVDDLNYRLYRVTGSFKADLRFDDFPFDQQQLPIQIQNRDLSSYKLSYVVDPEFDDIPVSARLRSGVASDASISRISNWRPIDMTMVQATLGTTSSLGDPELGETGAGYEHSELIATITIKRDVAQFLVKNLLPLGLVVMITYISLFFSHAQTTERMSFGITGVLTGAVLLSGVIGTLPEVGYTVAIEWAFYGFIILSAGCILVALVGGRLYAAKQFTELHRLDRTAQIIYPLAVMAIVATYWLRFVS
jgi:branched-chain amino acid transport system substrate-binding protein